MTPFKDWAGMVRFIRRLQSQNDDCVVILDGPEGAGKSTLAFRLAYALERSWSPDGGVIIDYDDWLEVYETGRRGAVYLLDEGGDLAFSREAMSRENKHVVRILQMSRILNHVLLVCCPNMRWLDVYVRDHRALIYVQVQKEHHAGGVRRGFASVYWRTKRFNAWTGEMEGRWSFVYDVEWPPIPRTDPAWRAYERLKVAKLENRSLDLQIKGRR